MNSNINMASFILFVFTVVFVGKLHADKKVMSQNNTMMVLPRAVYKGTDIFLQITSDDEFLVEWLLRWMPCMEELVKIQQEGSFELLFYDPLIFPPDLGYKEIHYQRISEPFHFSGHAVLVDESCGPWTRFLVSSAADDTIEQMNGPKDQTRRKRTKRAAKRSTNLDDNCVPPGKTNNTHPTYRVNQIWEDGFYIFLVKLTPIKGNFKADVEITMVHPVTGQLQAFEWPSLILYRVMCGVYVICSLIWLAMLAMNWRDLLRIQFWIGAIVVLGTLHTAVVFSEYESLKNKGHNANSTLIFAAIVSSLKSSLFRMLVVIISMDFGVVKPRLGLCKVLGVGTFYFLISSVEGILRVTEDDFIASILLAILDAAIWIWIFRNLVKTTRMLRLGENVVKLNVYRRFTYTLIFSVVVFVLFMLGALIMWLMLPKCTTADAISQKPWIPNAIWQFLFFFVLLVIIILWRPTANNQSYAFSPLLDCADDCAVDPKMNEEQDECVKNQKTVDGIQIVYKDVDEKVVEDLQSIEENIPATETSADDPS